jgi:lon-related putative ATP-dependent protease
MYTELKPEQLKPQFTSPLLDRIKTTLDAEPVTGIIAQERAINALQLGLEIQEKGFHIYVAGPRGIGKMTAVTEYLHRYARQKPTPSDWCYVHNFDDPYEPKALELPPGQGKEFQKDISTLLQNVRAQLPKAFDSDDYNKRRLEIMETAEKLRNAIVEQLQAKASAANFSLYTGPFGVSLIPLENGQPMTEERFRQLSEEEQNAIGERRAALFKELSESMKIIREIQREADARIQELDRHVAHSIVGELVQEIAEKYRSLPDVLRYLRDLENDMVQNRHLFMPRSAEVPPFPFLMGEEDPFRRYQVNLLIDHAGLEGAPVVIELNPTHGNLFGKVEKELRYGALYADFTLIKPGSLHKANGGFLVLPVEELLSNLGSWDGLKRCIRTNEVFIEDLAEKLALYTTKSLRPQPIPLNIKIILIGNPLFYQLLYALDDEFPELFKVKAEFHTRVPRNEENLRQILGFLRRFCEKENLKPLNREAIQRVLEHSCRLAESQNHLSTEFGALADVVRESHFYALKENSPTITQEHINKTLHQKIYRANLIEERIQEMIAQGEILLDTQETRIGVVNGLSVISVGDYEFGKPSRITATVALGKGEIVDIEREVALGGPIHSKGVLILAGYLYQKYAQHTPLTLTARVVFEQSYSPVEGDSASSAELYALLSALANVPIKQGIAVTGSVNQRGEIQPIGGVNEKVEGYFRVCKHLGLHGEQGVLIPESNKHHLVLSDEVVEAVRQKKFHIYTAKTVDEGIELLTGMPAGVPDEKGLYPDGTVHHLVQKRLQEFAEAGRRFQQEKA